MPTGLFTIPINRYPVPKRSIPRAAPQDRRNGARRLPIRRHRSYTKKQAAGLGYTEFAITSPTADQTFFGDDVVSVNLSLEPALKPEQTITWHLNGKELDDQAAGTARFSLPHLDRGAYVIAATITDPATGDSRTCDSVTFYVRQPSELSPQHKTPSWPHSQTGCTVWPLNSN